MLLKTIGVLESRNMKNEYVWKPLAAEKLSSRSWIGPCEVLDDGPDELTLLLRIPNLNGKGFREIWIHISHTKSIQLTKQGALM